jgi:flagellar motor switch protein FliM
MEKPFPHSELDAVFQAVNNKTDDTLSKKATLFDFRRPDRIAKSQLRAIHQLHENFVRNLVSSLSAYLRSYLMVNLVSVEQLSFAEFLECLPSPTCIASLGLPPYDGNAVLELNSSLIFPILEMLLGGSGKASTSIQRELTDIERSLLDGLFRIILQDLKESWRSVTTIDFSLEALETEPQFLQVLSPSEAVVAIAIEIRIGESVGMMNIAIPSIIIKMMRQKFDQQWSVRKSESTDLEQVRIFDLICGSEIGLDVRLEGCKLTLEDLMQLEEGDILSFDAPVETPLRCLLNGIPKFQGRISAGEKRLRFHVAHPVSE